MNILEGIRVIDLSHALAGPFCTHQLALLGADVIKIEPPVGDDFRGRPHGRFESVNAGKRSVVLDLKSDGDRDALLALVATADIVVENFKPGAAEKLGLDWTDLHSTLPRLISCSISGYGQTGPLRDMPAIEWSVQATSGLSDCYLGPETDSMDLGIGILDPFSGYVAFSGILAALYAREKTGRGKRIDVSMLDSALALQSANTTSALLGGPPSHGRRPTMARYRAGDRRIFIAGISQKWLEKLCTLIERPELLQDERFADGKMRDRNAEDFVEAIEAALSKRPAEEWEQLFVAAGIPAGMMRTLSESAGSDQVRQRGLIGEAFSERGIIPIVRSAFLFEGEDRRSLAPVPALGEHTEAVLQSASLRSQEH
ncbi:CaiB/BaiF CoA-transferase family protein [Rhizobium sp. SSA_523]|uniref:CaiB/BaiF CoA transferase family protein n=1 Tax=Rhizobium sp. SSA_523 TaxID=2952477 RepID=UPI002090D610|nr:CoA transferase [Rhizobium sp. SSA_523]MCO5731592.1 CoA transferase [Rhizobium sp. SSA_523]WKC21894.1 CoA transferase [Rhizobium sp. SSA_523]